MTPPDAPSAIRLAILTSHPIQYQAPLFQALSRVPNLEVEVLFCCKWGLEKYTDPGFGKAIAWDVPLVEGYKHRFLRNLHPTSGPTGFFNLSNPGVAAAVFRRDFHAVLINGWAFSTNWICWAAAALRNVPVLLRGESSIVLDPPEDRSIQKRFLLSLLFRGVSAFVSIGANNSEFYRSFGIPDEKIYLAPYSVDNSFFSSAADNLEPQRWKYRADIGIQNDAPVVLFCGKLQRRKRPKDLLEAYGRIASESNAWLAFVGDGELRAELEQYAQDHHLNRVRFLGFKNQTEIIKAYLVSDIFVLPSDFETWGLVVNEAMCFGLPIITSDRVGASADLVRDKYNGYVYRTGDVAGLAEHLLNLIQDAPLRRTMGIHSKEMISLWDLKQTAGGILRAVSEVVADRAKNHGNLHVL